MSALLTVAQTEWVEQAGNTTEDVRAMERAIDTIYAQQKELTRLNIYRLARIVNYAKVASYMHDVYGWEV